VLNTGAPGPPTPPSRRGDDAGSGPQPAAGPAPLIAPPASGGELLCESLLLAVTGSPAVLAMPQYVLMMRQSLVRRVRVMMSSSAQRFLRPYTMRLFAGGWVYTDTHRATEDVLVPHIELTAEADLLLVMPATANILAKAAHGICDDLVSTAILACPAPVVMVPAMNEIMWRSRAVQANVAHARDLGYHVIDPGIGLQLADMKEGPGQMPPLEQILGDLIAIVSAHHRVRAAPP
jgi:phosphopantothenoylcysteine synthetase/decarboxylase